MNPLLFSVWIALTPNTMPEPSYRNERILLYVTAAADVITTRNAIINGGMEGNPVLKAIVGREPSTLKLIGMKAVSITLIELLARYLRKHDRHDEAKRAFTLTAYTWGMASGFNLRFAFK